MRRNEFENYKMVHVADMGEQIHTFQDSLCVVEKCGTIYNESYIIFILQNKLSPL